MLGGLARRVMWVEKAGKEKPVLVVDSGDLFFERKGSQDLQKAGVKAEILARAYVRMGAAAVNVGDLDLLRGVEFLRNLRQIGLPLISANLIDPKSKKPIFDPYVIQERGGLKVAFLGLLAPEIDPQVLKAVAQEVEVADPWETAKSFVAQLRSKVDLLVVLSDMGQVRDQRLAGEVQGIDLILGGHDGRFLSSPIYEEGVWIFQSYAKGMYVGELRIRWERSGEPLEDEGKLARLQQQIAQLETRLEAHKRALERNPNPGLERSVHQLEEQRNRLVAEMEEARTSHPRSNRFSWRLQPMDPSLPEDGETGRWIKEAGVQTD